MYRHPFRDESWPYPFPPMAGGQDEGGIGETVEYGGPPAEPYRPPIPYIPPGFSSGAGNFGGVVDGIDYGPVSGSGSAGSGQPEASLPPSGFGLLQGISTQNPLFWAALSPADQARTGFRTVAELFEATYPGQGYQVWLQQSGNGTNQTGVALPQDDARRDELARLGSTLAYSQTLTVEEYRRELARLTNERNQRIQRQEQLSQGQLAGTAQRGVIDAQSLFARQLVSSLSGPFGPGMVPVINAALQALGLPPIQTGGGLGHDVMPNGITPAMWDAMPQAAKQLILLAWQARGGASEDFLAGINAQRPSGGAITGNAQSGTVRYARPAA